MKKIYVFTMMFFALVTGNSFAKSTGEIITASTDAHLYFYQSYKGDSYKGSFSANLGYDHAFEKGFGFGGEVATYIQSGSSSFSLLVGPSYNFQAQDIENSYYVGAKIGLSHNRYYGISDDTVIGSIDGGKRFKLAEGITYSPGLTLSHYFVANSTAPSFTINIFRFSLIF